MHRLLLTFLFAFTTLATTFGQLYEDFQAKTSEADGRTLLYRLLEPLEPIEGTRYPIIIFLHGAGERGDNNRAQLVHVLDNFVVTKHRSEHPCYVVAPQCPSEWAWTMSFRGDNGMIWADTASYLENMIMDVVDELIEEGQGDPDRVYLMGLSMGGIGTWDMMVHFPDRFAAGIPICGIGNPAAADTLKDIPIWAFHGRDDSVVPISGSREVVNAIQAAGGRAILTAFDRVGHNSWDYVFEEQPFVYDWLFAQRRD